MSDQPEDMPPPRCHHLLQAVHFLAAEDTPVEVEEFHSRGEVLRIFFERGLKVDDFLRAQFEVSV
jgi:hypothetical protein